MRRYLKTFMQSDSGATATEYAFLAACIAVLVAATLGLIGSRANALYSGAAQILS
ncbi:MAG: hypothetical protein JWM33_857 [Caulobacteraceae bacterium]|nr:hypothetical protein [Caulobacteraceae bacterium]